jgi:hypothetical protein
MVSQLGNFLYEVLMNFLMKFLICTVISVAILSAIAHFTTDFTLYRIFALLFGVAPGVVARLKIARPAVNHISFYMFVTVLFTFIFILLVGFNII